MGTDQDSVLDLQLRVRGVAGLRVADASALRGLHALGLWITFVNVGSRRI
jgi:choline dehydrogenase-like flavoprotein